MEENNLDFATAREAVTAGTCFTTHTPVPAGNDVFPPQHDRALFRRLPAAAEDRPQRVPRPGPAEPATTSNEPFCMTVLAIRLANTTNGVSKLHGEVSRKMWQNIWPELPEVEMPITSITNGVHTRSLAVARDGAALRPLSRRAVGRAADRSQHLEARRQHSRRRTVADARTPPRTAGGLRPQAAASSSSSGAARRRPRSHAPTRCSTRRP